MDLGHIRWNLAMDYGVQAADELLAIHQALTGAEHHPYWDALTVVDLVATIDPADPLPAGDLARLEAYLTAALARR